MTESEHASLLQLQRKVTAREFASAINSLSLALSHLAVNVADLAGSVPEPRLPEVLDGLRAIDKHLEDARHAVERAMEAGDAGA